jgi:serine/threonine protein kinase
LIKRGVVYIADFGLAYNWTEESKSKTEGIAGAMSLDYVAPEVFEEKGRRSSADMWSPGCIFLDMTVSAL